MCQTFPPWEINAGLPTLHRVDLVSWPGAVKCMIICGESGSQEKEGEGARPCTLSLPFCAELTDAVLAFSVAGSVIDWRPHFLPFLELHLSWGGSHQWPSRACGLIPPPNPPRPSRGQSLVRARLTSSSLSEWHRGLSLLLMLLSSCQTALYYEGCLLPSLSPLHPILNGHFLQ